MCHGVTDGLAELSPRVDPFCINQDDTPERVTQVVIIKDIYSSAIEATARVGSPSRNMGSWTAIALTQGHNRVVQKAGAA